MAAAAVIGREEELGAIRAFLAEVEKGPSALVLSGEAGIGKTLLWGAGVAEAEKSFGRVLACHGVEAEASLSFAALSELISLVLEEAAPSLAAPRRRALEIALRVAEPGGDAPDNLVIGLAVLDVLRLLSERGSVLVALDDVQWLDASSAGVLQIAFRRLRAEPVGVLATLRTASEVAAPFEPEQGFPEDRRERISLGALSLGGTHNLLKERLGLELTRPELARVHDETAGNPFFALELGRELVRTNTRPTSGQALHIPESLRELLGDRLARLPAETVNILVQVAALARPTVQLVSAVYGDEERVVEALEAAAREGVVELDDSRIRFAHPLLASICYEQAPVWKRRAVHRVLASAVFDLEERARHMALAAEGPDAGIAAELDAAAEQAAARGASGAAAELSELAAELTPADPALARQRRLRAATFHRLAGDSEPAKALLDTLLTEVPSGIERADVLFELANIFGVDVQTQLELCDKALAEASGDDARSARILSFRGYWSMLEPNIHAALADTRAALEKAERAGDPAQLAMAIAHAGHFEAWATEITPGLLERGAEIEERLGLVLEFNDSPRSILVRHLIRLGETERARSMLEELETQAAARGHEYTRELVMWYLSVLEWLSGRWQQALDHAAAASELGAHPATPMWAGRVKALIEADLGLVDEARASAQAGLTLATARSQGTFTILVRGVFGRIELALGNLEAAGDYLRELPGRLLAGGLNDPAQPVWADAIETLVALGELEQAQAYLEAYELHARRLGSALALEGSRRCRGLLTAAEGDLESALVMFESTILENPEVPWPFERARTLFCFGVVRRQAQQKKASRETLEQALASFEELGARLWAEKARAELGRISGRRTSSDELTETEHRVAELAAHGRTNKEIAAELFMGVSTVEAHLSHVYRKLGVRRAELGGQLATLRDEAVKAREEAAQA
jgi:DNA-binding CsgD family transcriptional regulator